MRLGVKVTEEAFIPAAKGKVGHWRGHANVDADVAGVGGITEFARDGATGRKDASHVAVGALVDDSDGVINCFGVHQAQDRPKNFGLGKLPARIDIVEDGGEEE